MSTPAPAAGFPFHEAQAAPAAAAGGCPVDPRAAAFDPVGEGYQQDPPEYLRWAREQAPIFWSPQLGYWVVSRYEDVKAIFRDNLTVSPSIALEKITPTGAWAVDDPRITPPPKEMSATC